MFGKLKKWLASLEQPTVASPEWLVSLNDHVATLTEWTPKARGGANFCTRRLRELASGRLAFRTTFLGWFFPLLFVLVGTGVSFGVVYKEATDPDSVGLAELWMPILIGVCFSSGGGFLFYRMTRPVVFDRALGLFWKGVRTPRHRADADRRKNAAPLDRIHALQIVSEWVRSKNSSYFSYELNVVLDDGSRINVTDHAAIGGLRADAERLAEVLGVPVWDAS